VRVTFCCTTGTASAGDALRPGLVHAGVPFRFVVSDHPADLVDGLRRDTAPCVCVVLKAPQTSHALVSRFVREFAAHRRKYQRLLVRDWEPGAHADLLREVADAISAVRRRSRRTTGSLSAGAGSLAAGAGGLSTGDAPRRPLLPYAETPTYEVSESCDSLTSPPGHAEGSGVRRRRRVWFGFAAAMVCTIATVLSLHVLRRGSDLAWGAQEAAPEPVAAPVGPGALQFPPLAEPSPSEPSLQALVAGGVLRVLDLRMGHLPGTGEVDEAGAIAYCDSLSLAGSDAWRLAGLEDLDAFRNARMLPAGHYWAADPVRQGRALLTIKDSKDARAPRRSPSAGSKSSGGKASASHASGRIACVDELRLPAD